jgi:DNA-binding transcriptional LysR family regulator
MDIESLKIFIEVARGGTFTSVANNRDADPSSISRSINSLEERLGMRLFQRTTRQISLTEAGALYLTRIEPMIEELERAGDEARAAGSGPSGTLRLTTSVAFGQIKIVPLLPQLRKTFPALRSIFY